ncbi:OmpA family protein [Marinilongibacter aquaticus]|uniref:OmpA family protein n=1 Tax=Marinilongibacter aquaticus TaxID=2975157 RepID=UPI0021BD7191|nr:OmpA family protein [Marinilongibacter aquaticus]UBM58287.1 OmpA family protein [Marinilongibacter aquaticus]
MKNKQIALLLLCFIPGILFAQNDKEGSKDHPLIQRFKDSYIYDYEETSFNPYIFFTGKGSTMGVEGKVFRIFYSLPTSSGSTYEIFTNYKNALTAKGATILYSCKNTKDCGNNLWNEISGNYLMPAYYGENLAYLAAKFSKDGLAYYIVVTPGYGLGEQGYEVDIVETKEMDQQISLDGIEKALNENGKVSLYGILFDSGSDKLQPSSYAEIELIAQYLKNHGDKKVYIVGHTDNTGNFDLNMGLSEKRAQAVVNALSSKYNISSAKMKPIGVGPAAPESNNTTDAGRKKNRRVEVVLNES